MPLNGREQEALTELEHYLRHEDPRLAQLLAETPSSMSWAAVLASVGLLMLDIGLLSAGARLGVGVLTAAAYVVFPLVLYPMFRAQRSRRCSRPGQPTRAAP